MNTFVKKNMDSGIRAALKLALTFCSSKYLKSLPILFCCNVYICQMKVSNFFPFHPPPLPQVRHGLGFKVL